LSLATNVQLTDELGRSVPISNALPGSTDLGLNVRVVSQPAGGASTDVTDRAGRLVGVVSVTGTVATDEVDRVARVLGHVVVDNASLPVTGTFWQATQPVSGTFWQATQPVSGTFFQATQPVSIATMPSTPVTGTFWQATQPVSGTFWQAVQPISGTVTSNQGTAGAAGWPTVVGIADSVMASGSVATPGIGAAIATIAAPGAGTYEIQITSFQTGAQGTQSNMQLQRAAVVIGSLQSVLGTPVASRVRRVTVGVGEAITVNAIAADATVGVIYQASIIATRVA
jgi:hypothetical protein